eukprot:383970-Pyramimonas_sp.AAC.1
MESAIWRGALGSTRKQLLRKRKTLRRQHRRNQLLQNHKGSSKTSRCILKELECEGVLTGLAGVDRTRWSTEITRYATASCTNSEEEKRILEAFQELKHKWAPA